MFSELEESKHQKSYQEKQGREEEAVIQLEVVKRINIRGWNGMGEGSGGSICEKKPGYGGIGLSGGSGLSGECDRGASE
ncbi:unnamed protein product [Sphagnum balticum]